MSFRFTSKWKDEEALVPKNVWEDDLDAFTASWENLNEGGHGTWYDNTVDHGYTDEITEAYEEVSRMLHDAEAEGRTAEAEGEEEDLEDTVKKNIAIQTNIRNVRKRPNGENQ